MKKPDRMTRVNELIQRELGQQVYRIVNDHDLTPDAVTFTRIITSADLRNCRVPSHPRHPEEVAPALSRNHRVEFQAAINKTWSCALPIKL